MQRVSRSKWKVDATIAAVAGGRGATWRKSKKKIQQKKAPGERGNIRNKTYS
jgi:hypothetical protein